MTWYNPLTWSKEQQDSALNLMIAVGTALMVWATQDAKEAPAKAKVIDVEILPRQK